jgi:hypothetical protein
VRLAEAIEKGIASLRFDLLAAVGAGLQVVEYRLGGGIIQPPDLKLLSPPNSALRTCVVPAAKLRVLNEK